MTNDQQELQVPAAAWVLHRTSLHPRQTSGPVAWCRVRDDGEPGYAEIRYFLADGVTEVPAPDNALLGEVITKLWC